MKRFLFLSLWAGAAWSQPNCTSLKDVQLHQGQRVVVWGIYRAEPVDSATGVTGIPDFKPGPRPYGRASVEVLDGKMSVDPPMHKTSLRSPEEREDYAGQHVRVVGKVGAQPEPFIQVEELGLDLRESKEYQPRSLMDSLPGLTGWKFLGQEQALSGQPWDLARDYEVVWEGTSFRVRLFRFPAGPVKQPPPARPDGLQVAYSTAGTPAHVGKIWVTAPDSSVRKKFLRLLAEQAFASSPSTLQWLEELPLDTSGRHEQEGLKVEGGAEAVVLEGGAPLEARRIYAVLEPRVRRRP